MSRVHGQLSRMAAAVRREGMATWTLERLRVHLPAAPRWELHLTAMREMEAHLSAKLALPSPQVFRCRVVGFAAVPTASGRLTLRLGASDRPLRLEAEITQVADASDAIVQLDQLLASLTSGQLLSVRPAHVGAASGARRSCAVAARPWARSLCRRWSL